MAADTGELVEGAYVFAGSEDVTYAPRSSCSVSGEDGVATLVPVAKDTLLHVVARGFLPASLPLDVNRTEYEVQLHAGRVLRGRVVDHEGHGIPAARVSAFRPSNLAAFGGIEHSATIYAGTRGASAASRTDAHGRFLLRGLPAAPLKIWAAKDGWYPRHPMRTIDADTSDIELALLPVTVVVIRPVDADTGGPLDPLLPRILVSVPADMMTLPHQWVRADANLGGASQLDGVGQWIHVVVPRLGTGAARWRAPAHGLLELSAVVFCAGFERSRDTFTVKLGTRTEVKLPIRSKARRHRTLSLDAHFAGGKGFDGALRIMIVDTTDGPLGYAVIHFRDGKGERSIVLPAGRYFIRPASLYNDPTLVQEFWDPIGPESEVDLEHGRGKVHHDLVVAGGQVELEVVDAHGVPVRGYNLGLSRGGKLVRGEVFAWDVYNVVRSGEEGGLPRLWLPPGESTLRVHMPGVGRGSARVDVADGGGVTKCLVRLK